MKSKAKKPTIKKIALILSLFFLIIWSILGAGASLAWFSDSSPEIKNIFHFSDFELAVSHRLADGSWEKIDSETKVFDDKTLYEPGYVQIVYLKIENSGDRSLKFSTAVNVNGFTTGINIFGQAFLLQDHLKFGIITANTEQAMENCIKNRGTAKEIANMPLHNYDEENATKLTPGETKYITLIIRMPESVNNVANYRGGTIPKVELGITAKAEQIIN